MLLLALVFVIVFTLSVSPLTLISLMLAVNISAIAGITSSPGPIGKLSTRSPDGEVTSVLILMAIIIPSNGRAGSNLLFEQEIGGGYARGEFLPLFISHHQCAAQS